MTGERVDFIWIRILFETELDEKIDYAIKLSAIVFLSIQGESNITEDSSVTYDPSKMAEVFSIVF